MQNNFLPLLKDDEILDIEQKIGYIFKDKRLLVKAFTHSSIINENKNAVSNERLEFLGDRILNFIIAENLFFDEAGDEGALTEKLKDKVSRTPLSDAVKELDLLKFLKTSEGSHIESFENKAVSDLYEAIVAAIYVDSGKNITECSDFIGRTLKEVTKKDYISLLKEYGEKNKIHFIKDIKENADGSFKFILTFNNNRFEAVAKKKKCAERECAEKACKKFNIE